MVQLFCLNVVQQPKVDVQNNIQKRESNSCLEKNKTGPVEVQKMLKQY